MSYVYTVVSFSSFSFSGLHWWFCASLMCPLLNIYIFLYLAMLLSKMVWRYSYGHTWITKMLENVFHVVSICYVDSFVSNY